MGLQLAFRPSQIVTYVEIMGQQASLVVDEWCAGQRIQVDEEMRRIALAIHVRSLFGTDLGDCERELWETFSTMMGRLEGVST